MLEVSYLSHKGKRESNQDRMLVSDSLFAIADGVGGELYGDEAAELALSTLRDEYNRYNKKVNLELVNGLGERVIEYYKQHSAVHEKKKHMSSTIAGLYLEENALCGFHIGDSRLYHYRKKSEDLWHTRDHSFVQALVDTGDLEEVDMSSHPRNNQITRAISLDMDEAKRKIDIHKFSKAAAGDIFILCSDGVLESFSELELLDLCKHADTSEEFKRRIEEKCALTSNDNYTAIIVYLLKDIKTNAETDQRQYRDQALLQEIYEVSESRAATARSRPKKVYWLWLGIAILILGICIFIIINSI